ncbi:MAG: S-adenosylmethionine:tRNAribosyltransferase-isomerase [Fibrobacterota bacterium]
MNSVLDISAYDFELPEELVAQEPSIRGKARMLVSPPGAQGAPLSIASVSELPDFLKSGDVLVVNDTRVIPARLRGHFPTGGAFEILLLEDRGGDDKSCQWEAMVRPGRKLRPGARFKVGAMECIVEEILPDGERLLRFPLGSQAFLAALAGVGEIPLPPYIKRDVRPDDNERYQTVFARESGAVAAPTAGLHLTQEILDQAVAKGVRLVRTTLHVGAGTFAPVKEENALLHPMHEERYSLSAEAAMQLEDARAKGGRIIAVGTTSLRTLETVWRKFGHFQADSGRTRIFLHPLDPPRSIQGILTNFHWPRSTLILLVAGWLGGRERWREVYDRAIEEKLKFFSYGDCMLSLKD